MLRLNQIIQFGICLLLCVVMPACLEAPKSDTTENPSSESTATKSATIVLTSSEVQASAADIDTDSDSYTFPDTAIESINTIHFTLTNTGDLDAKITSAPQLQIPFSYTSGSFPGNEGTCSKVIAPKEKCTISVSFSPSAIGNAQTTYRLIYNNGKRSRVLEKTFIGKGYSAPTINTVTPLYAAQVGGSSITLSGTQYFDGATVKIDGKSCAITSLSSGTITCTVPAHSAGNVDIVVTNTDGKKTTLSNSFYYPPLPVVTSVSPSFGALAGGTLLTLTGSGFISGMTVTVGEINCTSVNVVSSTTATCTTGGHAAGAATIVVTNTDTQSGTASNLYTYVPAPTVTSLSQNSGAVAGGNTITVTGTGFINGISVSIGGASCSSVVVNSPTQLTCTTSSHASLGEAWTVTTTSNAPARRSAHTAVWTGSKMIIFGGPAMTTGGQYDPVTDSWTSTATSSAPSSRYFFPAIWTGTKMIVFGGTNGSSYLNTGGQYDPIANSWVATTTSSAPSVREFHTAIWTGAKMLIFGGWDGSSLNTGGQYDPTANSWSATSTTNVPSVRDLHTAIWTGSKMIVFGGSSGSGYLNTGGQYDPIANSWVATSTTNVPSGRNYHTAVWTGSKMVVFGGFNGSKLNTGGQYDPIANSWSPTAASNAPSIRHSHTAIWTGTKMIAFGGWDGSSNLNTGGQYDPTTNSWSNTATNNVPSIRQGHTAIWTGSKMLVFGGTDGSTSLNTGGAYTPPGLGDATTVTVTNLDSQTGTLPSAFTYQNAPQVFGVTPSAGALAGGTSVQVLGSGFTSGATVLFGGTACTSVSVKNSEILTCTTPLHVAGNIDVVVTNTDTQSGTGSGVYTYQAAPSVTSVSPTGGALAGSTAITITGSGFLSYATVTVGGVVCTNPNVTSATTMTCTTGAHAAAATDIVVTNVDSQSGTGTGLYTYRAAPTVTSVSPNAGALAGGNTITLTGTGFVSGATVTVGGTACTSPSVGSSTSMTCTLAAKSAGAYTITVTNSDNQSGSLASAYTYQPAPTVSAISTSTGTTAGGTYVTITGTGFLSGISAALSGSSCNFVTRVSSTSITCFAGAHAAGLTDLTVTNSDNQSATLSNAFTYSVDTVSSTTGFYGRSVFRIKGTYGAVPTCTANGNAVAVSDKGSDWYQVSGLSPNTIYNVSCSSPAGSGRVTIRTLGNVETFMNSGDLTYGATSLNAEHCLKWSRKLVYNQNNGDIIVAGSGSTGSFTGGGYSCAFVYTGYHWFPILLGQDSATGGHGYQTGNGLVVLSNGTIFSTTETWDGSAWNIRVSKCTSSCQIAANWTSIILTNGNSGIGSSLTVSQDESKLVITRTTNFAVHLCTLSTGCISTSDWTNVYFGVGAGNAQGFTHFDVNGGMWVAAPSFSSSFLWYCPPTSACTSSSDYTAGKLISTQTGEVTGQGTGLFNIGNTIQMAGVERSMGKWAYASCDPTLVNCGAVSGGVFTNFTTTEVTLPSGMSADGYTTGPWLGMLSNGFSLAYQDSTNSSKITTKTCINNWATCSSIATSNWTGVSANWGSKKVGNNTDSGVGFTKGSFVDANDEQAFAAGGWSTIKTGVITYFD